MRILYMRILEKPHNFIKLFQVHLKKHKYKNLVTDLLKYLTSDSTSKNIFKKNIKLYLIK